MWKHLSHRCSDVESFHCILGPLFLATYKARRQLKERGEGEESKEARLAQVSPTSPDSGKTLTSETHYSHAIVHIHTRWSIALYIDCSPTTK